MYRADMTGSVRAADSGGRSRQSAGNGDDAQYGDNSCCARKDSHCHVLMGLTLLDRLGIASL
jgi:hypothetical protein